MSRISKNINLELDEQEDFLLSIKEIVYKKIKERESTFIEKFREYLENLKQANSKLISNGLAKEMILPEFPENIIGVINMLNDSTTGAVTAGLGNYVMYIVVDYLRKNNDSEFKILFDQNIIEKLMGIEYFGFKDYVNKVKDLFNIPKSNNGDTNERYERGLYIISKMIGSELGKTTTVLDDEKPINILNKDGFETIQKIFYGAPGTGKSYKVSELIKEYSNSADINTIRTTVYQDYTYYDFIGSIIPKNEDGSIKYDFKPGPFTIALETALKNPKFPVFLVVEEMSRGNIASIFGDIFQLLDRKTGTSDYSIDNQIVSGYLKQYFPNDNKISKGKIYLPANLNIIGTVNTSDQNVNVIDTAFKRRFDFEYVSVEPINDKDMNNYIFKLNYNHNEFKFEWNKFYMVLNEFITENLGLSEDKQIGQFFIKFDKDNDAKNFNSIKNKLLHYLWDDVISVSFKEDVKLFDKNIKTFGKLYKTFEKEDNVFSEEFLNKYIKIVYDDNLKNVEELEIEGDSIN